MLGQKIVEQNLKFIKNNMKPFLISLSCLLLSGCAQTFMVRQQEDVSTSTLESLHELRAEVAQLTHLLHGHSVDLQLIEEKISNLSLKKRELLTGNLEILQQKVDQLESVLATTRMNLEQSKKQQQQIFDTQLQRLATVENRVTQHDASMMIIKDLKSMVNQLKPQMQVYRVEGGDTLEAIARKFGVRVSDIKSANQLDKDQIQVGQSLKIPL